MSFLFETLAMLVLMPVVLALALRWRHRAVARAHPDGVEARLVVVSGAVRYVPRDGMTAVGLIGSHSLGFAGTRVRGLAVERVVGRRPLAGRESWSWVGAAQVLVLELTTGAVVELTVADEDADAVAEALAGGTAVSAARAAAPSPRRWPALVLGGAAVVSSLGIVLTGVTVTSYLSDRRWVPLAQELAGTGVPVDAELSRPTGAQWDPPTLVTFTVGSAVVTTPLLGNPDVPDTGMVAVRYLPDDPTKVLLADDVDRLHEGLPDDSLMVGTIGLLFAAVLLGWVAVRRSRRAGPASPAAPGATETASAAEC
ncbi:MAG: hypothetical protein KJ792_12625 [Actinobacteria bacterium]|nr:hypothetical protein [Actinomycetota bacterium]MCG2802811.1 hypothetical protein [Cellulomonas sp.]